MRWKVMEKVVEKVVKRWQWLVDWVLGWRDPVTGVVVESAVSH